MAAPAFLSRHQLIVIVVELDDSAATYRFVLAEGNSCFLSRLSSVQMRVCCLMDDTTAICHPPNSVLTEAISCFPFSFLVCSDASIFGDIMATRSRPSTFFLGNLPRLSLSLPSCYFDDCVVLYPIEYLSGNAPPLPFSSVLLLIG